MPDPLRRERQCRGLRGVDLCAAGRPADPRPPGHGDPLLSEVSARAAAAAAAGHWFHIFAPADHIVLCMLLVRIISIVLLVLTLHRALCSDSYDLHIAHEPIELPRVYFDRQQALVNASSVHDYDHRRTTCVSQAVLPRCRAAVLWLSRR